MRTCSVTWDGRSRWTTARRRSSGAHTALMAAAVSGHADVVRILLDNNAAVDVKGAGGQTADLRLEGLPHDLRPARVPRALEQDQGEPEGRNRSGGRERNPHGEGHEAAHGNDRGVTSEMDGVR